MHLYLSFECFSVSRRNIEGRTTDLISSLTSGYERQGYVPVPKPNFESGDREKIGVEETNNYGHGAGPTPQPSSFPTGMYRREEVFDETRRRIDES